MLLPMLTGICAILLILSISFGEKDHTHAENKDLNEMVEEVFPQDQVIDVHIAIDPDEFQDMLDNAMNEEYKAASVEYNGQKFDHVGLRTKGNSSLFTVASSDSDRYSLKISFDEYLDSQTFNGIRTINLNNNFSDPTYMRDFLTYAIAEEMGLPTPGRSYVNLYINGELWGFYLAVEQIGEAYLERHFGNSYGALYKAGTEIGGMMGGGGGQSSGGGDLQWRGDKLSDYPSLVQKSKSSNNNILINMLDELNHGTDYEKVMNVEAVLKYIALNVVTNNTDSYLGSTQHNYYLYEDHGIFSVLPWDYNLSFSGMSNMFGGMGQAQQGDIGNNQSFLLIDEPTQGALAERPLIANLLAVDDYKQLYHKIIQDALNGLLANETFSTRVEELKQLIAPHVEQDPRPFYTYEQFEEAVPDLISYANDLVNNLQGQLDGDIPSSGDGSGSGGGFPNLGGGQMPNMEGGQMPNFGGQMEFPGPFGQGGQASQGNILEAIMTGVALVLLGLSGIFVVRYKRKNL